MRSIVVCFYLLLSVQLYAQRITLNEWLFHSDQDTMAKKVRIPHTWNAKDAFDDEPGYWRGKGYYVKEIQIADLTKSYFLHFNGANQVTKVWVNEQFAGEHIGGYTAFDINISSYLKQGSNVLKIEVDNSHSEAIPPLDADFTFYGGIYRNVYLDIENPVHFNKTYGADAVRLDALVMDSQTGLIKLSGSLENPNDKKYHVKITVQETGKQQLVKKVIHDFNSEIVLDKPHLWSPETPYLYTVRVEVLDRKKVLDDMVQKVGFRKIEATTQGFFLNDKSLKLVGVNRHQDWKGLGNAVPVKKQLEDLVQIKEMGANFLRLAHYPQDKAIYKAADSLGLILWSEIPVVNRVPDGAVFESYKSNALNMQREHIAQNYHHPSLVFIGYMNEIFLRMVFDKPDEKIKQERINNTLDLAAALEELTREEAPQHISVMALHGNQIYNDTHIAELPMVIGWNLYYGWYGGEIYELGGFLDEEFKKFPKRPLIISEYGVGADIRLHNDDPKRFDFSEEYQFKYHPGYYSQVMERNFVIGMSAWNYADFGSEFRGDAMPHINQKGLVSFNRKPKNILHWYKASLHPDQKLSTFFKGIKKHYSDSNDKRITIITNQEVLLKDNYGYQTLLKPQLNLIHFYADLIEGENIFELYTPEGEFLDRLQLTYSKPNLEKLDELAINLGMDSYFLDNEERLWIPAQEVSSIKVEGNVKTNVTSTNIRETVNDPLYQTSVGEIESIFIDVPKGAYQLSLLFSTLEKGERLAYELDKDTQTITDQEHAVTLVVNTVALEVPLIRPFHKKDIEINLETNNGIRISGKDGNFQLSGILIRKK